MKPKTVARAVWVLLTMAVLAVAAPMASDAQPLATWGIASVVRIVRAGRAADHAAAVATEKLADLLTEQGRQELLAGQRARAAVYLGQALAQSRAPDVAIRSLLGEAMHSLDAQRSSLEGHTAELTSAAFSPDGRRIVTASRDATAQVWDAATGHAARPQRQRRRGRVQSRQLAHRHREHRSRRPSSTPRARVS